MNKIVSRRGLITGGSMLLAIAVAIGVNVSISEPSWAAEASNLIVPQPIPPQFGIPGNREQIQKEADQNNVTAIRAHAWDIWSGLTADSKSHYEGDVLPIWETWLATADVFTSPPTEIHGKAAAPNALKGVQHPSRAFTSPHQFSHLQQLRGVSGDLNASKLVGFNKFDPSMTQYAWQAHSGPAEGANQPPYFYTSAVSQLSLNQAWPASTAIADRKVVDAPNSAFELKPVLMWVDQQQLTAIPLWEGPQASTAPGCSNVNVNQLQQPTGKAIPTRCHPDPSTWTYCVLIDATNPSAALRPATAAEFSAADTSQAPACESGQAQYAGIDMLYSFVMSAKEAVAFNLNQGGKAVAGDSAVLVAMHVNTKEIVDWTWQTFWWHAGEPTPNNYPGSSAGLPSSLPAPWKYYDMCAVYSQTTKPNNQGEMNVCFNPYLETSTGIPDGLRSNCMSCHITAAVNSPPTGGYPLSYSQPVEKSDPRYFACATQLDFSYALAGNPTDAPKSPPPWDQACPKSE